MLAAVRAAWPLLLGILFLTLGQGLQGTLLGVRAALESFPTALTGLVMSGYALGFLVGSLAVPGLIRRVGHVRVFAALGSIASCAVLIHPLIVDPWAWLILRFVTGAALCGVFIATESWLNASAGNEIRGRLLSAYLVVQMGGFMGGQALLNTAPPSGFVLFILASILLSIAIVPILLTAAPAPPFATQRQVSLGEIYSASPLGLVAIIAIGIAQSAFYHMGAVFAGAVGLTVAGISAFMAIAILGGVLFQWPLGLLSDRFDRRLVLTIVTFLACACALVASLAAREASWTITALFFVIAGLSLPMYGICVAHANDYLTSEQMVGASGTLLLAYSIGSVIGPVGSSLAMQLGGAPAFPLFIAVMHGAIGLFALWRMSRRAAPPLEAQGPTIPLPTATATPVMAALAQEQAVEQSPAADGAEAAAARAA